MERVERELDVQLERRWDALYLRLIEDRQDPAESWIYTEQQRIDREWRANVLAEIREQLTSGADVPRFSDRTARSARTERALARSIFLL
jgi:hypothetical protein